MRRWLVCLSLCWLMPAHADGILGDWLVPDDDDGKPSAVVSLTLDAAGNLQGHIRQIFARAGEDPDPRCSACKGERHDQKVRGMRILWGMSLREGEYAGGEILDPDSGDVFHCRMKLAADGRSLDVRAYLGVALFGRTQHWQRAP